MGNDHNRKDNDNRGEFHNNSGRGSSLLHHHCDRAASKLRECKVTFRRRIKTKYSGKQSHKCPLCFVFLYVKTFYNLRYLSYFLSTMHPEIVLVSIVVI